jgi:hypothetical protein
VTGAECDHCYYKVVLWGRGLIADNIKHETFAPARPGGFVAEQKCK